LDSRLVDYLLTENLGHPQTFQPPSHANLEDFKKEPRKTLRLGPQTSNNNYRLYVSEYSLPYLSSLLYSPVAFFVELRRFSSGPGTSIGSFSSRVCLSVPAILLLWGGPRAHKNTHGWRLSLALLPFPSQISFHELNLAVKGIDSSIFLHTLRNYLAIKGFMIHCEIRMQNRETLSWHPKP